MEPQVPKNLCIVRSEEDGRNVKCPHWQCTKDNLEEAKNKENALFVVLYVQEITYYRNK